MEGSERDSTGEWEVPRGRGPLLIAEIEERVDMAVNVARASEQGVREIGEAALDAARQARRAAEMAEAASAAAAEARDAVSAGPAVPRSTGEAVPAGTGEARTGEAPPGLTGEALRARTGEAVPAPLSGEARLRHFSERCDRVSARLRALERRPGSAAAPIAA